MPAANTLTPITNSAPPLTPKLAPWMERLIAQPETAHALASEFGSPVHVLVGDEFRRNVQDLLKPCRDRGLTGGGLFFARKANKLPWFVSLAKEEGIGVDTASLTEVKETLELGVDPQKIIVTAVGKERAIITLAIQNGCLLVIDNTDELQVVENLAVELSKQARVGLRFSGFKVESRTVYSRFGFPIDDADVLLQRFADCARLSTGEPSLSLEILHAHLDRYDTAERGCAAFYLLQVADRARALGHKSLLGLDMGGGILMRYLQDESQWLSFQEALPATVRGDLPPFTFQGDGLGYYRVGKEVHGNADLYPAFNRISKERFVTAILDYQQGGSPLYKELAGRGLSLWFEPGRALLDNTGITLAAVTFRKLDTQGNQLVGLAMNRMNLRPFRAEFCVDPIILPAAASQTQQARQQAQVSSEKQLPQSTSAFLVGGLCSESDLIFRRRIALNALPELEDLFLFPNTSGYLMHHMEIGTHGDGLPANVLLDAKTLTVQDSFGRRG